MANTSKSPGPRGQFRRAQSVAASIDHDTAEAERLRKDKTRTSNWKRWGPYLSERQWGTVREDYSADGSCWTYFPHDHARSRAYRWGEDGLLGISDRQCRLCFAPCMWNEKDPILKERLFGLVNHEGNHGEDVKECYYYLESTPTHSYMKALYKYPQSEYPYGQLVEGNRARGVNEPELELESTGVFDNGKYWDVFVEYAKKSPDDILIRLQVCNRGPAPARIHVLPTLWYRNTWIWGCKHEGCTMKPSMKKMGDGNAVICKHETLGTNYFYVKDMEEGTSPELLWTENETNTMKLFGSPQYTPYVKDAFHRYVINNEKEAVNPKPAGTKMAAHYILDIPAGGEKYICMRLTDQELQLPFEGFDDIIEQRKKESDMFYAALLTNKLSPEHIIISKQCYAGTLLRDDVALWLLWSKQFFHYVMEAWLNGDPEQPPPPEQRKLKRSALDWKHLFNRDVISMPDKWEYPWYASWDLAFHMIPFAKVDPEFAKEQLILFLREWYMAPNGQIPAYEFNFSDVNPPVHAWAVWRVYKMTAPKGSRDVLFLERCFHKLILNFNWWVNRKDPLGKNIFAGGFLGLDNVGLFDRSKPLPNGMILEQADGTAWMAFFCVTMLDMALELACHDMVYEDMASKFFEHFVAIVDAMNQMGGEGLWHEEDGFYYDHLRTPDGTSRPIRVRSIVGLIPLFACLVLEADVVQQLPGFQKRMNWFMENRKDIAISSIDKWHAHHLLAIPRMSRLKRMLEYMLDEDEFLSPFGIRSLSKKYGENPVSMESCGDSMSVSYVPGESNTYMFGGNSNWRGPIWLCVNFLIIESLERYHYFYGEDLKVRCPTKGGVEMTLREVSKELCKRVVSLFEPNKDGYRPCHGEAPLYAEDPHWNKLVLFYEYFHGDNGKGCGAR
eukprot:Em0019g357a